MTVIGPDFVALQVGDLERSANFYQTRLGLRRAPTSPPGAVVFVGPADGPFGRMFTLTDPDGYAITIHDQP